MTELVAVAPKAKFKEDILTSFDVEGVQVMGIIIDGNYIVTSRICTHKEFDLTKGHYAEGYVTCTLHTSTFDLEDGDALNPPATEPLRTYKTVVKNDIVYIDIDD